MNTVRLLFDLRSGFGVGDGVQTSILWKHLRKHRPHWVIDVRAPGAFAGAILPFVRRFWPSEGPDPDGEYEAVHQLNWTDCFDTFADRPSTKVAYALRWMFGIEEYDPALGRYEVVTRENEGGFAASIAEACDGHDFVVVHSKGSSHPERKNLSDADARSVKNFASDLRLVPLDLDFQEYVGVGKMHGLISRAAAFVGIDSGPGKVASATDTPTLICWTGHHPLRYHDPAPNTTHLIPERWHAMSPFGDDGTAIKNRMAACRYFLDNYKHKIYEPGQLAAEACRWLRETLT